MSEHGSDLHALEKTVAAAEAVRQVIGAVWTLARAQQGRVDAAATEASNYLEWVLDLVSRFAVDVPEATSDDTLWVVLGPERPFCGGLARRFIDQFPEQGDLIIVGRRLADAIPTSGTVRDRVLASLPAAAAPDEIDICARRVAATLLELTHVGSIRLLHPVDGGSHLSPVPLVGAVPYESGESPDTYSPVATVLGEAMQEAVSGCLVVAVAEALRSEVRARLLAAESARQGCDRKIEVLRQQWRVQRQESTTNEILELYSGRLAEGS